MQKKDKLIKTKKQQTQKDNKIQKPLPCHLAMVQGGGLQNRFALRIST